MNGYQIAEEQIKKCPNYKEWAHFLVKLRYRYDFEKEYCEHITHLFTGDPGYWQDDWCEGQTDVIVDGILDFDDVPAELFQKEIKNKKGKNTDNEKIKNLIEKTVEDFEKFRVGDIYFEVDGKIYDTDTGYATDGIKAYAEVLLNRLDQMQSEVDT